MILTRAPLRLGLFGGGSDIPEFYRNNKGVCVSATIDKYIHLAMSRPQYDLFKIVYSEIELVKNVDDIKHNIIRETLKLYGITDKFELSSFADIPVRGTGLGSSSTFTVALAMGCVALKQLRSIVLPEHVKRYLAETACRIEIDMCHQPIGKQDQYAAAFGGLNKYIFNTDGHVDVEPVKLGCDVEKLESRMMLFYTGVVRNAEDILKSQFVGDKSIQYTKELVALAEESVQVLEQGNVDLFGEMLDTGWKYKKMINPLTSSSVIDHAYDLAKDRGAVGGKIVGAGGGGYLLLFCDPKFQQDVRESMEGLGYTQYSFKFENRGCEILYG